MSSSPDKVIIFDFDGTLADSAPIIRNIYTELAQKNNWRPMTDEDYMVLRRGSLRQARKWAGIKWWQFPLIIRSAKKLMHLESEKVKLFPDITELIQELMLKNVKMYVLSRNSSKTILQVLDANGLVEELEVISLKKRTFGSKALSIRKLLRLNDFDPKRVWMVGDEVRDVEAAKIAGVRSIAVTWGLQDEAILELTKPDHLVSTVGELRKILL